MTKKHFIELADWLRKPGMIPGSIRHALGDHPELLDPVMDALISDLASFCCDQNHRFDRQRFIGYIKGENGPNGGRVK